MFDSVGEARSNIGGRIGEVLCMFAFRNFNNV